MSQGVQENSTNPHHSLYHYGLIKLLIEDELKFRNDSWDSFLVRNAFNSIVGLHQEECQEKQSIHSPEVEQVLKKEKMGISSLHIQRNHAREKPTNAQ
jgi:hypothetical protein